MKAQKYDRFCTVELNKVLPLIPEMLGRSKERVRAEFDGVSVNLLSQRLVLFKTKGLSCVSCGLTGTHFAVERNNGEGYHLNLYATNENGEEILMTKDHIIPRSKGGKDQLKNYQTMCRICNHAKGNKL